MVVLLTPILVLHTVQLQHGTACCPSLAFVSSLPKSAINKEDEMLQQLCALVKLYLNPLYI